MRWSRPVLLVIVSLSSSTALAQISRAAKASPPGGVQSPLPEPPVGDDALPLVYLQAAAQALAAGRAAEAQEAMERAESRALVRSLPPSQASIPDHTPLVRQIAAARAALASGDRGLSRLLLQAAIRDLQTDDAIK